MAKYCKYCGKELEKGKICTCQKENKDRKNKKDFEKAKETIKEEVSNSSRQYTKEIIATWKGIFKDSKATTQNFIESENQLLTMIIICLTSVILSFCVISFLKGINSVNLLNPNQYYTHSTTLWNHNNFKALCCIFIGLFLGKLLLGVVFSLGFEKINQKNITFKKTLATIAISLIEPTTMIILSTFLTFFSYKLTCLLIIYSFLLFFTNLYQNFKLAGEVESNHYNRLFVILIVVFGFLAIYLIPNLFI